MGAFESKPWDWKRAMALTAGFVIVYFLSVGPAARLMYRSTASPVAVRTFEIIYAPVIWLEGHTFLSSFIYNYVSAWGGIDD